MVSGVLGAEVLIEGNWFVCRGLLREGWGWGRVDGKITSVCASLMLFFVCFFDGCV